MIAAYLHTAALVVALCVQSHASPLAGAWVLFHWAGCAVLLYQNSYKNEKTLIWWASLMWLVMICISTFILAPVKSGGASMFILSAMPMLALCLKGEQISKYIGCFATVIAVYSAGLIFQKIAGVRHAIEGLNYSGYAWPLLDPNNAACIVNCALIPAFYMSLRNTKYIPLLLLYAGGLYATDSMAGFGAAGLCMTILIVERNKKLLWPVICCLLLGAVFIQGIDEPLQSFASRFPIWEATGKMLGAQTWLGVKYTGLGLGTFPYYYAHLRTEYYTGGWYAHNDMLQIAAEMGMGGLFFLTFLLACVFITTTRKTVVAALVILMVLLQASVEFQFYVAPVSLCAGLALAFIVSSRRQHVRRNL